MATKREFPYRIHGDKKSFGMHRKHEYREGRANHKRNIDNVNDLKASLRAGPYAWPGGYPLYFITADGEALSFSTVVDEFKRIADAIKHNNNDGGWRVVAMVINYEDQKLYDAHTGKQIISAYGE